jgi:hypothetical protein
MADGTWIFVPTAGPNSKYVVQAASVDRRGGRASVTPALQLGPDVLDGHA